MEGREGTLGKCITSSTDPKVFKVDIGNGRGISENDMVFRLKLERSNMKVMVVAKLTATLVLILLKCPLFPFPFHSTFLPSLPIPILPQIQLGCLVRARQRGLGRECDALQVKNMTHGDNNFIDVHEELRRLPSISGKTLPTKTFSGAFAI